jgi:hypothetical protein
MRIVGIEEPTYDQPVITALLPVVAEHIAAVNAFDNDRIVATFAPRRLRER